MLDIFTIRLRARAATVRRRQLPINAAAREPVLDGRRLDA